MAKWRQTVELAMSDDDIAKLIGISRSRTECGSRVDKARMLLAYRENPSFFAVVPAAASSTTHAECSPRHRRLHRPAQSSDRDPHVRRWVTGRKQSRQIGRPRPSHVMGFSLPWT
jgi:hypothetical protein